MNESLNHEAVCRTAPATPGLLIITPKLLQLGTWNFETMYTTQVCQVSHVKCQIPFVTSHVMGCMTSLHQNWSKTGYFFLRQCSPPVCVSCSFTKSPLFQRNRFTCSGNPSLESCVEVKAQQR